MADFFSPGQKWQERRKGPVTFPSVATSYGGFMGAADSGPINTPRFITSTKQFETIFGGKRSDSYLKVAVDKFFENEGGGCWVSRVASIADPPAVATYNLLSTTAVATVQVDASSGGAAGNELSVTTLKVDAVVTQVGQVYAAAAVTSTLRVASSARLRVGDTISITVAGPATVRAIITAINGTLLTLSASITVPAAGFTTATNVTLETFNVKVYGAGDEFLKGWEGMRMSPLAEDKYFEVMAETQGYSPVVLTDLAHAGADSVDKRPANVTLQGLSGGDDGTALADADFLGDQADRTGFYAFDAITDCLMLAVPGETSSVAVGLGLQSYLDAREDMIGQIDPPQGYDPADVITWRDSTANFASSYLEMHYPWVKILDSATGQKVSFPPSPFVQAITARTHRKRNFGKAPAGLIDGKLNGVIDLDYDVTKTEYDTLFPKGINAIQKFRGRGICVFGDRMLDPSLEFDAKNVRIVFIMVKRVFEEMTKWVNFEPNDEFTRQQVIDDLTAYLETLRVVRILQGPSNEDGFFIQCDDSNNDAVVISQSKMVCRVGLAVTPSTRFFEGTLEQDTRKVEAQLASTQ